MTDRALGRRRAGAIGAAALFTILSGGAALAAAPSANSATDPAPTLTRLAEFRLQAISFLVLAVLVLALLVQVLWNAVRGDAARWPRLTYPRAAGVVALWGLLLAIALAMAAGVGSVLGMPVNWSASGAGLDAAGAGGDLPRRRAQMDVLRKTLWGYAQRLGDGEFPPHEFVPEIPEAIWLAPHPSGMRYVYVGPRRPDRGGAAPVAYEPSVYGDERLVLLNDGRIELRRVDEVEAEVHAEAWAAQRQRGDTEDPQ